MQFIKWFNYIFYCCCPVTQSCLTLCDPMDCSTPDCPVLHYLPKLAQTHVHRVGDAIQPSHPLSPLLLPPSIFPCIRVFSNKLALCMRWPNYWSFSFSISPSKECSWLISFRIDWFDLHIMHTYICTWYIWSVSVYIYIHTPVYTYETGIFLLENWQKLWLVTIKEMFLFCFNFYRINFKHLVFLSILIVPHWCALKLWFLWIGVFYRSSKAWGFIDLTLRTVFINFISQGSFASSQHNLWNVYLKLLISQKKASILTFYFCSSTYLSTQLENSTISPLTVLSQRKREF